MAAITESDLSQAFKRWRDESQRTRYIPLPCQDPRRILAREVEAIAADKLREMGFHVRKQSHSERFDLAAIDGDRGAMLRCEVKASRWDGERYQFNLRDNDADVALFACVNGALHFFVIPFDRVRGKTVVKVVRHDPAEYTGWLTAFYEAWDILPDLARTARNPYQPELL